MSSLRLVSSLVLCCSLILGGPALSASETSATKSQGKPDKPDKPDNSNQGNKPPKVSWNPSRVEMSDVEEGFIVVELSADSEVLDAGFFASGSLSGVIGYPEGPIDILEGETVEIEFELLQTPEEAGRTIGGTIQLLAEGKHLARPLTFSLKRSDSDSDEPEDEEEELIDNNGALPLSWLFDGEPLDEITADLFDEDGLATIILVANRDLRNLGLWFTPSIRQYISASFDLDAEEEGVLEFDEDGNIAFVQEGTEVTVFLELLVPPDELAAGGTLHARSVAGNSRSYPDILGVRFEVGSAVSEPEGEVSPAAVVDAASYEQQPVAASQIVSIFGVGLGPDEQEVFEVEEDGSISRSLGGVMVLFDGYPAPLLSAGSGQINAIVPSTVEGGDVELQVLRNNKKSALFPIAVGPPTPSLFTLSGIGRGQAAALNEDSSLNGPSKPAAVSTVVTLFGSGGGPTVPSLPDGAVATRANRLAGDVRVFVGGVEADVVYAGSAPGLISAVTQFNIRINPQTPSGSQPVSITVDGVESNTDATIAVE